jgi:hypothetical protein
MALGAAGLSRLPSLIANTTAQATASATKLFIDAHETALTAYRRSAGVLLYWMMESKDG